MPNSELSQILFFNFLTIKNTNRTTLAWPIENKNNEMFSTVKDREFVDWTHGGLVRNNHKHLLLLKNFFNSKFCIINH